MEKQIAGVQANSVSGIFSVANNLQLDKTTRSRRSSSTGNADMMASVARQGVGNC
jgi:hypothetical protein